MRSIERYTGMMQGIVLSAPEDRIVETIRETTELLIRDQELAQESAANLSINRIARSIPLGLLQWQDTRDLKDDVYQMSYIGAPDDVVPVCAYTAALSVAMTLNSDRLTSHPGEYGWWSWLSRHISKTDLTFCEEISSSLESLSEMKFKKKSTLEEMSQTLLGFGLPSSANTVVWSLVSFMWSPKNLEDALQALQKYAGSRDIQTSTALVGGLVGCLLGTKMKAEHHPLVDLGSALFQISDTKKGSADEPQQNPSDNNVRVLN
jgi:hypothetical protein